MFEPSAGRRDRAQRLARCRAFRILERITFSELGRAVIHVRFASVTVASDTLLRLSINTIW